MCNIEILLGRRVGTRKDASPQPFEANNSAFPPSFIEKE